MSQSYQIFRYAPVFVSPAGTHPGRARCRACSRRITRAYARLGWHGRYYHIQCWWNHGGGPAFLRTVLDCLSDEMIEEIGLRVERDEPPTPTGTYNMNDFGVRMLRDRIYLVEGETYRVEYFTPGTSGNRFPNPEAVTPDEIGGARIIRSGGTTWWHGREGNFEVVLLEAAPEPEAPEPADSDSVMSETGVLAEVDDTVRFVRNMTPDSFRSRKSPLLGQEFTVQRTSPSSEISAGGQWYLLSGHGSINFYDCELVLVRRAGETEAEPEPAEPESAPENPLRVGARVRVLDTSESRRRAPSCIGITFTVSALHDSGDRSGYTLIVVEEMHTGLLYDDFVEVVSEPEPEADESVWVDVQDASELSEGDTVRLKEHANTYGNLGPGSVTTVNSVGSTTAGLSGRFRGSGNTTTWYYLVAQLERQR